MIAQQKYYNYNIVGIFPSKKYYSHIYTTNTIEESLLYKKKQNIKNINLLFNIIYNIKLLKYINIIYNNYKLSII